MTIPDAIPAAPAAVRLPVGAHLIGFASRLILAVLLLVTVFAVLVPFAPLMPGVGLDPSWRLGVNQAVSQGLAFGTDFIFSFGPYGAIYTRMFHPDTDALMLGGSAYLALSYWVCLVFLLRTTRRRWLLVFGFALAGLAVLRDPLFFIYPLLVSIATFKLTFAEERAVLDRRWAPGLVALLFAPFGLLPLVKGSVLALCVSTIGLCLLAFASNRRLLAAAVCVVAPVATMVGCWLVAGQALAGLPGYFIGLGPIVSGYTEAMALSGNMTDIWVYLVASAALLLAILAQRNMAWPARAFLLLNFALYLFVTFKAGFVRHDGHAIIAGTGMLFAAFAVPFAYSDWSLLPLVALATCSWWQIDQQYVHTTVHGFADETIATYTSAWRGIRQRLAADHWPDTAYQAAIAFDRAQAGFPILAGTSDIYPFDQSYLIASGNSWSPRPVFQSYSVYTPVLAEWNRRFLLGARAPDNIIFKVEPIDFRFPSLDDGASWPLILQRYTPMRMENEFLFLKRNSGGGSYAAPAGIAHGNFRLGQRVELPVSAQPVFVQLKIRQTWLGRLADLAFKPSQLQINVELANGGTKQYRMVAEMAESGFLISPLIESTREFGMLYGKPGMLAGKRVVAMTMLLPGRKSRLWQDQYEVSFSVVRTVALPDVTKLYHFDAFDGVAADGAVPASARCEGSIDRVNNGPVGAVIAASGELQVDGWLAASTKNGQLSDAIDVVLTDAQGSRKYLQTHESLRPDVGAAFKQPLLAKSGYTTIGDISGLKGPYRLGLARKSANEWIQCSQFSIPVNISN